MNRQKGFIPIVILLGILVVAGLVGVIYLKKPPTSQVTPSVSSSSAQTSDWKIYTNPLGYSIKYPANWFAETTNKNRVVITSVSREEFYSEQPKNSNYGLISIKVGNQTARLEDLPKYYPKGWMFSTFNGYRAFKFEKDNDYFLEHPSNKNLIVHIELHSQGPQYKQINNQILSTLRFTE